MVARAHPREQPRRVGILAVHLLRGCVEIFGAVIAAVRLANAGDSHEWGVGEARERREPHVAAHGRRPGRTLGFNPAFAASAFLGRSPEMRVLVVVADDLRQRLSRILRRVERAGHRERPLLQQQRGRQDRRDRRVPLAFPVEVRHRQRGMLELHQARRGLRGLGPALAAAAVPRLVVRGGHPALAGGWWWGFERCPRRRYAVEEPRVPPLPRLGRHDAAPGECAKAYFGLSLFLRKYPFRCLFQRPEAQAKQSRNV